MIGDKLSIKSEFMKSIFQSVTKNIIEHIDTILADDHVKNCSLILLVGGFSESEIVQNEIRKKFETEERRVIIPAEAGLSVLKGATITGHAQDIVTNHVLRYSYGVCSRETFDAKKHPQKYKFVDESGVDAHSIFSVLIKQNTPVEEGQVVKLQRFFPSFNPTSSVCVYAASKNVRFVDEDGCQQLCKINIMSEELKEYVGQFVSITINFIFGRTELGITVDIEETGTQFTASVEI